MPSPDDENASRDKADWFSRQPKRMQALLLALLLLAVSLITFLLGMHDVHAGVPVAMIAGRTDPFDSFMISAGALLLGACLLAVAMGWIKAPKPQNSDTPARK